MVSIRPRPARLGESHGSPGARVRVGPGSAHRHPRHRARRRAGGVLRADARGPRRRRHQGRAARRQPDAPHRPLLRGPARIPSARCSSGSTTAASARSCSICGSEQDRERFRALVASADVLLESTPKGELDELGLGTDALAKRIPDADRRARDAVRRRRPVGGLQGLRPRPSRARRRDDELRLRSGARRQVRPAADRAADVARLPRRRRAARVRDRRRAALSLPHGQGPASSRARCTRRWRNPPRSIS